MEEPQVDLRISGTPPERGDDEGLKQLNQPEPLVIPPAELRRQYEEEYAQLVKDEATRIYVHMAEFVKVKSFKQVFRFMGLHMRVYNDARVRHGFASGGIRGRWWMKHFWTYTIWESHEALEQFMRSGSHSELLERMREFAAPGSCYVEWEALGEPDWSGATSRLEHPTRYYVDPFFG